VHANRIDDNYVVRIDALDARALVDKIVEKLSV
jgi:hypothetical protein